MCAIKVPSLSESPSSAGANYELLPEVRWKLDPLFSCCCNLFIRDILAIPLYPGGEQENVFMYKNHPVRWVSIMGIVVKAEERSKFFHYAVDDGTGAISCICWKPGVEDSEYEDTCDSMSQSLFERMESFHLQQFAFLEVGSLVNIRGKMRLYNDVRQISAFSYGKVIDPTHNMEIRAMSDQVTKYQNVYDVPFTDTDAVGDKMDESVKSMKQIAQDVSKQILIVSSRDNFQDFYLHELETVTEVYRVCCQPCQEFSMMENNPGPPPKQISLILKEAVKNLLENGFIFKSREARGLLHLTLANKVLRRDTHKILSTECQREEYISGCNFLHLYDLLRKRDRYLFITHAALRKLLNTMEEHGESGHTTGI